MSTKITRSLLLTLAAAALAGPTAAVAKVAYEPGDVPATTHVQAISTGSAASHYTPQALAAMGARMQAQADYYARSTGSIRHAGEILQQMGDHWAADAAFSRARAQEQQGTVTSESAPVGDRWGSDAYRQAQSTGAVSSGGDGRSVLDYTLIALGILLASIAAFAGFSQVRGRGSRPRVALP